MQRSTKSFIIIWFTLVSFVYLFYVPIEANFNRYPPHFTAFVNMVDNGVVNPQIFRIYQLSSTSVSISNSLPQGARYIVASNSSWPAKTSFYLIWKSITGLSYPRLMNTPIAPFIAPPIAWALVRKMIPETNLGKVLSFLFIMLYLSYQKTIMSNNNPAFTFPLMILILFFVHHTLSNNNQKQSALIITLGLFSLSLWWHSAVFRTGIFILSIIFSGIIIHVTDKYNLIRIFEQENIDTNRYVSGPVITLAILVLLIMSVFTNTIASPYMVEFLLNPPLDQLLNNLIGKSQGEVFKPVPYEFNYTTLLLGKIYFYSRLAIFLLTGIVFVSYIILIPGNKYSFSAKLKNNPEAHTFLGGVFLAQLILLILYARAGIGLWYMQSFAPFFTGIALLSFKNKNYRKMGVIFLLVVVVLSIALPVITVTTGGLGAIPVTTHSEIEPSHGWVSDYSTDHPLLTDFSHFGKYYYYETEKKSISNNFVRMSSQEYGMIIGANEYSERYNNGYAIVDTGTMKSGRPVNAYGARSVLKPKLKNIDSNIRNNKAYNDGSIAIYKISSK